MVIGGVEPTARADFSTGLSTQEARRRLAQQGLNALQEAKGPSHPRRFLADLTQPLQLWAAVVLGLLAQEPQLSAALVLVIVINTVFAFVQEYRAERMVEALRRMLPVTVHVRRDGDVTEIPSEEVVGGDVLVLELGDQVAADADLLSSSNLHVDESALTGESAPVEPRQHVFAGTYVTGGSAAALVTATGMNTRFGRIATLSQRQRRERTPIQREIYRVTLVVAALGLAMGVIFFVIAGLAGMGLTERFIFAMGVTVALVPNGLLPTVTLALAVATQRMAKRKGLVRHLSSVETLGETTVICTDKTGTLTENKMTAQRIWTLQEGAFTVEGVGYEPFGRFLVSGKVVDPSPLRELLRAGLLCNDTRLTQAHDGWSILGSPTEGALLVLAKKAGLSHNEEAAHAPRIFAAPFSSERKRMTTVHLVVGRHIAYVKGAAEVILQRTALSTAAMSQATAALAAMERDALHVLALARRRLPGDAARKR